MRKNKMKLKASKKEIRANAGRILGVSYCALQYLLKYRDPFAYSVGVYGWACDYYDIDGVIISTGYQPLSSSNVNKDYEMIHDYDNQAREINQDYNMQYEKRKEYTEQLLSEFINMVKKV